MTAYLKQNTNKDIRFLMRITGVVTEGTLLSRNIITEQIERNASKVAY